MAALLKTFLITIIILTSSSGIIFANDKQYWGEFKIKKNINKEFTFDIAPQIRFKNNDTKAHWSQINLSLAWNIKKYLTIIPAYQHIRYEETNTWKTEYRPNLSATLKRETQSLKFSDRTRIEYRIKKNIKFWRYRNKFMVKLPIKKTNLIPNIAGEVFYDNSVGKFNKYRMYYGITYALSKNSRTSFIYLADNDYEKNANTQKWNWQKTNIFFISLDFSF